MLKSQELEKYYQYKSSCIGSISTVDPEDLSPLKIQQWAPNWQISAYLPQEAFSFCPYCGSPISAKEQCFTTQNPKMNKLYACHLSCYDDYEQEITDFANQSKNQKYMHSIRQVTPQIGSQEFLIQIKIEHPISSYKYFEIYKKCYKVQNKLICDLSKQQVSMFEPNRVLIPLSEFKIKLRISDSKSQKFAIINGFKVVLDFQKQNKTCIVAQDSNIIFTGMFQKIENCLEKKRMISQMNFKYAYQFQQNNLILFEGFTIEIRQKTSSKPQKSLQQFIKTGVQVQEQKQINTVDLIKKIKTHQGSKQFQKNINTIKPQELQRTLKAVLPYAQEIILNQYGNYMFQSLMKACNYSQRMLCIEQIKTKICTISCQKQGTFVMQMFIGLFTDNRQFQELSKYILPEFQHLVINNQGNHLMRKFIQMMPYHLLPAFTEKSMQNLVNYCINKNGVCVMKSLLRSLKLYDNNIEIANALNQLLNGITINLYYLIDDQYGNYLIQEIYEKNSAQTLVYISQAISHNFVELSQYKFSCNVVINCIKKYWRSTPQFYDIVCQVLDYERISNLYENKNSNKILLHIVQMPSNFPLKMYVYGFILQMGPSKYNHSKWESLLRNNDPQKQNKKLKRSIINEYK